MKNEPNKPDTPNPAMTLQFHAGRQWRGVGDLGRSAVRMSQRSVRKLEGQCHD